MKKILKIILGISLILIIIFGFVNMEGKIDSTKYFVIYFFIIHIRLVVPAILLLFLIFKAKKKGETEDSSANVNNPEIEKKYETNRRDFYTWGVILSDIVLMYLWLGSKISSLDVFIVNLLFILSFIFNKKRVSNIIFIIAIIFACLIGVTSKIADNYNKY